MKPFDEDNACFHNHEQTAQRFSSETGVKRGDRIVRGTKELSEKLGRNDPCPCGSARLFQVLLPAQRLLLTA
jgi:uncharacterized protein YecA (UPF0149 family)